jgi:hypothetical protein
LARSAAVSRAAREASEKSMGQRIRFQSALAKALLRGGSDDGELRKRLALPRGKAIEKGVDPVPAREDQPIVGVETGDGVVERFPVGRRLDRDRGRLDHDRSETSQRIRESSRLAARPRHEYGAAHERKGHGDSSRTIPAAPADSIDSASSTPRASAREASPAISRRRKRLPSTAPT